ncbi:GNAT family N-acetyltransferase [Streptomyces puniciscabiei]|uniref:GNAT family N-acetyltransferase n=1 Tax=Streptomyces puniciscabiei TaxID=164348 RepID=UPI0033268DC4
MAHSRPTASYLTWAKGVVRWDGPVRLLRTVAVALDVQGQGLGHQAMETALDDIEDREGGERTLIVTLIHERNTRSQALVASHYFELAPLPCDTDPEMQYWFGDC